MEEISLVAATKRTKADRPINGAPTDKKALVAVEASGPPFFRCVLAPYRDEGARGVAIDNDAWEHLELHHSSPVVVLPIE
jgi:arginine N-succinyltransferase